MNLELPDMKMTFLHGELKEQNHMTQPEEFIKECEKDNVCLLKRSLYNLKHSPMQWYKRFDTFILENGFKRCEYDGCVYLRETILNVVIYLLLCVDDINKVIGFVDSYCAGCLDTRRSLTCYVYKLFGNTMSWKCNLQHLVSLSTTEDEFIVVTEAIKKTT